MKGFLNNNFYADGSLNGASLAVTGAISGDSASVTNAVGAGQVNADNVRLDGNTISATDVDGNLNLKANGTGDIHLTTPADADVIVVNNDGTTAISGNTAISLNQNDETEFAIRNTTDGTDAASLIQLESNGSQYLNIGAFSDSYTVAAEFANSGVIASPGFGALKLFAQDGSGQFNVYTGGVAAGNKSMVIDSAGQMTLPRQPMFLAYNSTQDDNVTGDGTVVTVEFDTEVFDRNADYNNTTDTFTAPVTGIYRFDVHVGALGITSSHDILNIILVTSNRSYLYQCHAYNCASQGTDIAVGFTTLADMDAADTAYVTLGVYGGTKVVDVKAISGSILQTWFAGTLVG